MNIIIVSANMKPLKVLKIRIHFLQGTTGGKKAMHLNYAFASLRKNVITYLFIIIYSMPAMCQELR